MMIKHYIVLCKPGIIMGNAVTMAAGFFLASRDSVDWELFMATLVGLACIIASACVCNNYIDRNLDKKMARTKRRALAQGSIEVKHALVYAGILGAVGIALLAVMTNMLTLTTALVGFFGYVVVYGYWKRRSEYGTLIGSIAGGVPPVVGYVAVQDRLDIAAILLFVIVSLWQMPHFFAIAIYRLDDYKAGSIPVLPAVKGMRATKIQMLLYVIAFGVSLLVLPFLGYAGMAFLVMAALTSLAWLWLAVQGFRCKDDTAWARSMFFYSLFAIMAFSVTLSVDCY